MASAADLAGERRGGLNPTLLFGLAAIASAALLLWAAGSPVFAGAFFAGLIGAGGLIALRSRPAAREAIADPAGTDLALLRAALDCAPLALALTDGEGGLICANATWSA